MHIRWDTREHAALAWYVIKWLLLAAPVAIVVGSAVALFLWLLEVATQARIAHPELLFALPLAGIVIALVYHAFGKESEGGNNLIMEQIHEPGGGIPWQMAPLVLLGTVITHLFGGSAGREGTAVQMGGSIASLFVRAFKLDRDETRILLSCGIAAGFGAVFGTPLTGALFALEVLALGRMRYDALIPCFIASIIGDLICTHWGINHTHFRISAIELSPDIPALRLEPVLAAKVALSAVVFGLASYLFAETSHFITAAFKRFLPRYWLRPAVGALIIIGLTYMLGTRAYLGLGVAPQDETNISIVYAFEHNGVTPWSWFWKLLFTAITLGSGFKGGEVTPLFFIGATLGNTMGELLNAPVDLIAAIGLVAVFAGATNTPLACTVMGVELFGATYLPYFALGCFLAYLFSGHSGIYLSQRVGVSKGNYAAHHRGISLRSVRALSRDSKDQQ
jgi:H+/Cl- antiporter ClcA